MAVNEELAAFVKEGLGRGVSRDDLSTAMVQAGWSPTDAQAALAGFVDTPFAIPAPRPRSNLQARDAFLYLVQFSTLFVVAINLGQLLFALIDHVVPDPAVTPAAGVIAQAIRWSASALIVATPVFLFVSRLTERAVREDPVRRASKVRRWLTYITLFAAAAVLLGDVTALVYNLLGGELTLRFVLKVLVVGAIAGTGFTWYLAGLRADEQEVAR